MKEENRMRRIMIMHSSRRQHTLEVSLTMWIEPSSCLHLTEPGPFTIVLLLPSVQCIVTGSRPAAIAVAPVVDLFASALQAPALPPPCDPPPLRMLLTINLWLFFFFFFFLSPLRTFHHFC